MIFMATSGVPDFHDFPEAVEGTKLELGPFTPLVEIERLPARNAQAPSERAKDGPSLFLNAADVLPALQELKRFLEESQYGKSVASRDRSRNCLLGWRLRFNHAIHA